MRGSQMQPPAMASHGKSYNLQVVHRFGSGILALVKHILKSHPAIQYEVVADPTSISVADYRPEPPCLLTISLTNAAMRRRAVEIAKNLIGQTAILVADASQAHDYLTVAATDARLRAVRTADDIQAQRYAPKSILVASATDVAGLQFDHAVIIGVRNEDTLTNGQQIALINQLYLAITRARTTVHILANNEDGLPHVLASARANGILAHIE